MSMAKAWILLIVGVLIVFVGTPMMVVKAKQKAASAKELRASGKTVSGTVDHVVQRMKKSDRIAYSFTVAGQTYSHDEDASRETTDRAQREGRVVVTYLPRDPSVSTVDLNRMEGSANLGTTWAPFLLAGVGLVIAISGFIRIRAR